VGKNLLSGWGKALVAVLLLFVASAVSASPTVISGSPAPFISSSDRATTVVACNLGSSAACDQMSELAKAILQPSLSDSRSTAPDGHYLPAVPPAVAMVLMGFMCISLVRDRKAWLAVLAGLLWAGQMGIGALPELTSRLSRRVHNAQPVDATLATAYSFGGSFYPESYSNETQYTGLLHHLAGIPRNTSAFTNNCEILTRHFSSVAGKDTRVLHHAILKAQFVLSELSSCLVSGTRQFVCFTPAFIFCQLPRGPPCSTWVIT
jgi:hypothetical protein